MGQIEIETFVGVGSPSVFGVGAFRWAGYVRSDRIGEGDRRLICYQERQQNSGERRGNCLVMPKNHHRIICPRAKNDYYFIVDIRKGSF